MSSSGIVMEIDSIYVHLQFHTTPSIHDLSPPGRKTTQVSIAAEVLFPHRRYQDIKKNRTSPIPKLSRAKHDITISKAIAETNRILCTNMPPKSATSNYHSHTSKSSPLHTYHSDVMQAMCSQMVHRRRGGDAPLPLAKKPLPSTGTAPVSSSKKTQGFTQHVQEEMARRAKADRVLQDLSSDKSRQQALARETSRRNKWAKNVASALPASDVPVIKKQMTQYKNYAAEGSRRKNPQVA